MPTNSHKSKRFYLYCWRPSLVEKIWELPYLVTGIILELTYILLRTRIFVKVEKKNSESSHVPLQPHDIKSITDRLLRYHAFWTIDSFTGWNEFYLFCLKVIVITVKRVSEFGMAIGSLFIIRECYRCGLYWLKVMALLLNFSSTYLIHEIYGQLKKKKEKCM